MTRKDVGEDPEEAEDEGQWEERNKTTKRVSTREGTTTMMTTPPPPPESSEAAVSSYLEPVMSFFWG